MKQPLRPFRTSIYSKLLGAIIYRGIVIPIGDEYSNKNQADINVGNNQPVKAWIKLSNETADDDSPKCLRTDLVSIQIMVQVEFNANSGNAEHGESIMDLILERLFNGNTGDILLEADFSINCMKLAGTRNLNYQNDTSRVWATVATITAQVSQAV